MNKETRMKVIEVLGEVYGDQVCGLDYQTPFELLIATMLSAQCTDVRVNLVTAELFKEYNTPEALLTLNEGQLKEKIKTCGLANTKAKNILLTCHLLLAEHGGIVPRTMEELTALPGVGRKTANVVMSNAFDIPAIAVDTHVFRVSRRIGLAKGNNVLQVENSLMKNIPKAYWSRAHHWIIWHGRKVCTARNPKCESCVLNAYCDTYKRENKEFKK
ncbi:endonuclease III [Eubacterium aggregans]|jgi:endonuclease-3|uniref:Endonuclease III n=1 Tax=Eubacterium aggregans TaxID=81409 RepID=A0A1H4A424_9FIRM|nr:endonuclease III [Eubacterium aggregans]MDD4691600.1 endonuclease III [Eubacterium aggregans]SEA30735.1 DNA-(apurinic or apyrimidinic site) lyase /endonuclease III [Eubacterium aggregans]